MVTVLCAVLITATLVLTSCGERDTDYMTTSPILGVASTEGTKLVEQMGDAAIAKRMAAAEDLPRRFVCPLGPMSDG
jgi:hypothetical protein